MYPNRALGLRVLTAVLMFLESFVDSSACLTNVLLPAVGLSAGQQVQAALIHAGHVLEYVVLFSRVMDIHHLNYSSCVSSSRCGQRGHLVFFPTCKDISHFFMDVIVR